MRAKLLLKTWLSLVALIAAAWYAVGSIQIGGIFSNNATAIDIIRQRCPIHLVSPRWLVGSDQFDILFRWSAAEMKARLLLLLLVWVMVVSIFVRQYLNGRRNDGVG